MRAPSLGLHRDGFWAQGFTAPGTGPVLLKNELGWNVSLQLLGRGVLVGWMTKVPLVVHRQK